MSPEENKAVVARLFEALNTGDAAALGELVAPECQIGGPAGSGHGPIVYEQVFELLRTAFPDVYVSIEEMLAAEGDRVIVRTRTTGTHQGHFMGIAPTNKPVTWTGVNFLQLRAGQITNSWGLQDRLAVFEHLGMTPPIGVAPA